MPRGAGLWAGDRLGRAGALGALVSCVAASVALGATAAPSTARFVYVPGAGADACAGGAALQRAVVARMGRDPFRGDAERTVTVWVERSGAEFVGRIGLTDSAGKALGVQELQSRADDCAGLSDALVLTLSMILEAPAGAAPAKAPPINVEASAPPPPDDGRARLGVTLGALVAFAAAPSTVAGASLDVEARWPHYALALEGRVDGRSQKPEGAGYFQTSLWMVTVVPCWRYRWLGVCGLLAVGVQDAEAVGIPGAQGGSAPYVAPGARLALSVPLGSLFSLQARTDLLVPVAKMNLYIGPDQAWVTPPVSFVAGLALEAQISR